MTSSTSNQNPGFPFVLAEPYGGAPPILAPVVIPQAQWTGVSMALPPCQYIYLDNHSGSPLIVQIALNNASVQDILLDGHDRGFLALPGTAITVRVFDQTTGYSTGGSGYNVDGVYGPVAPGAQLAEPGEYSTAQGPYLMLLCSDQPWSLQLMDRNRSAEEQPAALATSTSSLTPTINQGATATLTFNTANITALALDVSVTAGAATSWTAVVARVDANGVAHTIYTSPVLAAADSLSLDFGLGSGGPLLTGTLTLLLAVVGGGGTSFTFEVSALGRG